MARTPQAPTSTTTSSLGNWTRFQGADIFGNRRIFFARPGVERTELEQTPVIRLLLSGSEIVMDDRAFVEGMVEALGPLPFADVLAANGYLAMPATDDEKTKWAIAWLQNRGFIVKSVKGEAA